MTTTAKYFFSAGLVCILLAACGREAHSYMFKEDKKVKIDESEFVIYDAPFNIYAIDDSLILAFIGIYDVVIYNYQSGKLVKKISFAGINTDSLAARYIIPANKNVIIHPPPANNKEKRKLALDYVYYDQKTKELVAAFAVKLFITDPGMGELSIGLPFIMRTGLDAGNYKVFPLERIMRTPGLNDALMNLYFPAPMNGFYATADKVYCTNVMNQKSYPPAVIKFSVYNDSVAYKGLEKVNYSKYTNFNFHFEFFYYPADTALWVSNQEKIVNVHHPQIAYEVLAKPETEVLKTFTFSKTYSDLILFNATYMDSADNYANTYKYLGVYDIKNKHLSPVIRVSEKQNWGKACFYKDTAILFKKEGDAFYFITYALHEV